MMTLGHENVSQPHIEKYGTLYIVNKNCKIFRILYTFSDLLEMVTYWDIYLKCFTYFKKIQIFSSLY
jgi:hypothetical protein